MLPELNITVSKTADGGADYVQIISSDQFAINVVLIGSKINIQDRRPKKGKRE